MCAITTGRMATVVCVVAITACATSPVEPDGWSPAELEVLRSLWIGSLDPLPPDPSNAWADDPGAADLGHRLFFDVRLSFDGRVACATCHRPESNFQDGTSLGSGIGTTDRRTMPVAGTAYSPWQFWDGRIDSQWAQALGPLEHPAEHGGARSQHAHVVASHYRSAYEQLFGPLPSLDGIPALATPVGDAEARAAWAALDPEQQDAVTRVFVNIGKAIAAYERRIGFGQSRFDLYVEALLQGRRTGDSLSSDELAGLRLFIGRAGCTQCHYGPLLTNNDFHNMGVPRAPGLPVDHGRAVGVTALLSAEFNCRSRWSDAAGECPELDFVVVDGHELERAFRTPTLRNVAERPPYMHAGQVPTLGAVLAHYNEAPAAPAGHSELRPLNLSAREIAQLEAYLRTLTGPLAGPPRFLAPPH